MAADQTVFVVKTCKLMFSFKATSILPLLFLGCYEGIVTGMVILSPMAVAPVCRVGDPLQLTCTATLTGSIQTIRWSIFRVIDDQGTISEITNPVLIDNSDANQIKRSEMAATTFTYVRTSAQGASPLVSTLSIDSVSIGLNGTVVRCSDVSNSMTSASTTIYISAASSTLTLNQNTLGLSVHIIVHDIDNITVTVEWTQQVVSGITYTPKVSPPPLIINESSLLLLVLKYNTEYNLSVVANSSCGVTATAIKTLYYVNCGYPELLSAVNDSQAPDIVGYDILKPVEGNTVTFSCPPGLELNGSNSATCTGNEEWEPDPSWLTCNEPDSKGALSQIGILIAAAASSLASIFILASILLSIGCLWRRFSKKRKRLIDRLPPLVTYRKQPPHYDVVQFPPKQELPLKPNESYHSR